MQSTTSVANPTMDDLANAGLPGIDLWTMLRLLLFFSSRFLPFHLTSPRRSFILPEGGTHRSYITSDSYLLRSVLSRRLRSSFYSSIPPCSLSFYADASLRLGQALLGPCTFSLLYISLRTSCNISLTLTYSISPSNIPRSLLLVSDLP